MADPMKKPRADSKLKNLADADQEDLWTLLHPSDSTVEPCTLEAVSAYAKTTYGFAPALSSLSEWHSWYGLKRRMEAAAERATQVRMELAKDSSITPDDLERIAQTIFTAETLEDKDIKNYVALATLRLKGRQIDHDERRIKILETKAKRLDDLEAKAKEIRSAGGLTAEMLDMLEKQLKLL